MFHSKFTTFASVAVLAASALPSLSVAQPQYSSFTPDSSRTSALLSEVYADCVSAAGVNSWSKLECMTIETSRLERTLGTSYRTVLAARSLSDARDLRRDQTSWLRVRDVQCTQKLESLRPEPVDVSRQQVSLFHEYSLQLAQCRLQETQKRTAWLQNLS